MRAGPILRAQEGPQRQFGSCPADIVFYGGAAGGGKSWALVFEAARNHHVKGYAGIVFRRTSPELTGGGSVWEESLKIYTQLGGHPVENRLRWRFTSGASIEFSHLQHEKDVRGHQSKQYAFIGFDEVTHFTEHQFWYMLSRLRSVSGVKPYIRATCNPDPDSFVRRLVDWWIGEDGFAIEERSGVIRWLVRVGDDLHWYDTQEEAKRKHPNIDPLSFTFIASSLDDNPAMTQNDPGYRSRLEMLPRVERERLFKGNWNIKPAAGLYFQRSWFEFIDADPSPAQVAETVRGWDKAASKPSATNPDPDWTVGVKYSRLKDGRFCIHHAERLRDGPLGVERSVVNTAKADGIKVKVGLWQDPGGAGKADVDHFRRLLSGFTTKVIKATKDKITYAGPVSSQAEAGNIVVVRGSWNEPFMRILEGFPDLNHDDDVDGLSLSHMLCDNSHLESLRRRSRW